MIASILHGLGAAFVVAMALAMASGVSRVGSAGFAMIVLGMASVVAVVQHFHRIRSNPDPSGIDLERYDGAADLLIHLHSPALPDRASRWTLRGFFSWVLAAVGLGVGPEGVGMELSQAAAMNTRTVATRWSDLRRRTDAAQALAAGISAAFGAPFAAVLLPAELAIGGRVLHSVLASVSAYVGIQSLTLYLGQYGIRILGFQERIQGLWGFRYLEAGEWISAFVVCFAAAFIAGVVFSGMRSIRSFFDRISGGRAEWATIAAGVLLASAVLLARQNLGSPAAFFESVIRNDFSIAALFSLAASLFLVLAALYAGLGSLGVWWPSFLMGTAVSMLLAKFLVLSGRFPPGTAANSALLGAVAWSVVWFRTPITLAVLAYELSGHGSLLFPALLAGWLAGEIGRKFHAEGWIGALLDSKGFPMRAGRSVAVMKSVTAADAMVRDFQSVRERDSIEHCQSLISSSRYPFLTVVNDAGGFVGLLSVDLIEQGLRSKRALQGEERDPAVPRLDGLLEARDLLYLSEKRGQVRTARMETSLAELPEVFESQICVPVISGDGSRPVGLLFPTDVRHAYDRELTRISIIIQARHS